MRTEKRFRAIAGNGPGTLGGEPPQNNLFDAATITILDDGRVEAKIEKLADECDELIARTSQRKAASFIFNDLAPAVAAAAGRITPFDGGQ
jgi:hypothetical protein